MRATNALQVFVQAAIDKLLHARGTPESRVVWGYNALCWRTNNFFLCDHFNTSGMYEHLAQRFSETKRGTGFGEFTQGGKIPRTDYARRNQLRLEFLQRWAAKLEKEVAIKQLKGL